jgi:hypothetical protein
MNLTLDEALALIERQRVRLEHLERVLAANNIQVADTTAPPAARESYFPTLQLEEPPPKQPRKVQARAALEDMPRVLEQLTATWGTEAFDRFAQRLIIDERGNRQGFSEPVMEELLMLARLSRGRALLMGVGPATHPAGPFRRSA